MNWTEHVSKPAVAVAEVTVEAVVEAAPVAVAPAAVAAQTVPAQTVAEQLAAPIVPQVAEADAAFAAADAHAVTTISAAHTAADQNVGDHLATVTYIGRHAAGATPVPRQPSTAPRFRPRERATVPVEAPVEATVEALAYA